MGKEVVAGHRKLHAQILDDRRWVIAKKHKWDGKPVSVKRSIIGGNTWYVSECPECGEGNTIFTFTQKRKIKYDCEECGLQYNGKIVTTKVVVAKTQKTRKQPGEKEKQYLLELQHNSCYWCHREFGFYVWDRKRNRIRHMTPVYDHYQPFSFTFDNTLYNFVVSCQVCNSFKYAIVFNDENDLRQLLEYKWNKALDKGDYEIL